ncbi:ArsR/SmtB family transcription factor [Serpentinicella alkaliphila]|uniref:ArsR family transcriptional regulator n=1 Tax=Serpentinicella alkaliphila TaxID=1734049 RepID=A0A4R2TAB5_9FIRM|nr:metalloregulator ArsR/SmtB family transcription factor [Serpentinicella alkaliphila]QUH25513.1 helix-turn-helix transcriptional regulator [Serpentinicella alkaliphila]TCP99700.1 ArsR family transcriptional regulator [Serpentinicella alkaliphila]
MKKDIEVCEIQCIHEKDVKEVKEKMMQDELILDMAEFFKVFGDATRVRIMYSLFDKEMCVCDIAAVLEMNQSAISHQLRILKAKRLVKFRRDGKIIYYSLDDDHVKEILDKGLLHIKHK